MARLFPSIDLTKFWAVFNSVKLWSDRYGAKEGQDALFLTAGSDLAIAKTEVTKIRNAAAYPRLKPAQLAMGVFHQTVEIPPDAIPCSQALLVEFLGQSARGGTVKSLESQGVLKWQARVNGKLWVVFRNPVQHAEFRAFMEKRGKARKNVE